MPDAEMTLQDVRSAISAILYGSVWRGSEPDGVSKEEALAYAADLAKWVQGRLDASHYVTFDENGWVIEHPLRCHVEGTLLTCGNNAAIREIATEYDLAMLGRWKITDIDSEGLPSLEGDQIDREQTNG